MKGITNDVIETLAMCESEINLPGFSTNHKFHIIPDDFPITCDGILGNDFLKEHLCKIDLQFNNIEIPTSSHLIRIPLRACFEVPARSESIFKVSVSHRNDTEVISIKNEISPGVFIGGTLCKIENGHAVVSVINTTESSYAVDTEKFSFHDLDNYDVFNIASWQDSISFRLELLEKSIDVSHLNSEEKDSIIKLCRNYNDIFHLKGDKLSVTDAIEHKIPITSDSSPINCRQYRLPESTKSEINKQVQTMLEDNVIENSKSPWNFPLLVVPKKSNSEEKKWRVVVDFRKLNDITVGDSFPLPNIVDILDNLGKANYYTTLDLADGYHQVPIQESDREKTAFSTSVGHYQFTRMPFGLKGAPATFQFLMNAVLSGLNGVKCFVYLDDVVVYGYNLHDHNSRLSEVLDIFRLYRLKLNPSKCQFLRKEISYLGHIITPDGIKPDPNKTAAIKNYPIPQNHREVKSFLGLVSYYRRFSPKCAEICKPLIELSKPTSEFTWSAFCDESFNKLKTFLIQPPILIYPDFDKTFFVTCDASDVAIGAVLSQQINQRDHPISYISRVISKAEKNYSVIEKELLAIVWAVERFRPYVYGRLIMIVSDHKPLIWLCNLKDPSSRLMRWRIRLDEYQYKIIHKPGALNSNVDALSRVVVPDTDQLQSTEIGVLTRRQAAEASNTVTSTSSTTSCPTQNPIDPSSSLTQPDPIPCTTSNDISLSPDNNHNSANIPNENLSTDAIPEQKDISTQKIKVLTDPAQIEQLIREFHISSAGGHQGHFEHSIE